jgi:hypothetical protein
VSGQDAPVPAPQSRENAGMRENHRARERESERARERESFVLLRIFLHRFSFFVTVSKSQVAQTSKRPTRFCRQNHKNPARYAQYFWDFWDLHKSSNRIDSRAAACVACNTLDELALLRGIFWRKAKKSCVKNPVLTPFPAESPLFS